MLKNLFRNRIFLLLLAESHIFYQKQRFSTCYMELSHTFLLKIYKQRKMRTFHIHSCETILIATCCRSHFFSALLHTDDRQQVDYRCNNFMPPALLSRLNCAKAQWNKCIHMYVGVHMRILLIYAHWLWLTLSNSTPYR